MTKKEQEKEPRKRSEIGKRKSLKLKEEKSSKSKKGCARERKDRILRWEEKLNEDGRRKGTGKRKREKKSREELLIGKRKDKKGFSRKGSKVEQIEVHVKNRKGIEGEEDEEVNELDEETSK